MKWQDRVKEMRRVTASELRKNPKNWREHPEKQQSALKGVLEEVGIAGALIARETPAGLELIDGHLRAEMDDETEWPVLILDVTEEEANILLAAIDPIAALATRDDDALRSLLDGIETDNADLNKLLADLGKAIPVDVQDGKTDPNALPDDVEQRCEPGDLWVMGRHRLLCGDSTSADDMARLLDGAKPELCITDPPYGVEYEPEWRLKLQKDPTKTGGQRLGKVTNDDRADWGEVWGLIECDVIYHWCAAGDLSIKVGMSLIENGFQIRNQIIWKKTHFPLGRGHYTYRHEPCWYAVKKGRTAHWIGDATQSSVWEVSLDENVPGGHSTQKPVDLFVRPIVNHEGDVLEPFAGSGTCVIACEQTQRTCFAMEIDPHYCDAILARWEAFTEGKAVRQE